MFLIYNNSLLNEFKIISLPNYTLKFGTICNRITFLDMAIYDCC